MSKENKDEPKKEVAQVFQGKTPSDPNGETSMFDYVTMRYMDPLFDYLSADPNNQLSLEQLGDLSAG